MNWSPTILREWSGRGWRVMLTDDQEQPLRVNTASAAPDGTQAMSLHDAQELIDGIASAIYVAEERSQKGTNLDA